MLVRPLQWRDGDMKTLPRISHRRRLLGTFASILGVTSLTGCGSLRDDLRAMFTGLGLDPLPGVDIQRVFPQMIAAAKVNDDVAAAYRAFITERRRPMQAVLRRAVARGELAADVDLDLVHDLLVAPVVYRWLVSDGPVDESVTTRLIEIVLTGVDALPRLEV